MRWLTRLSTATILTAVSGCGSGRNVPIPDRPSPLGARLRPVELRFIHSPYPDYLFYLLYRDTSRASELKTVPLDTVPTLSTLIALPEMVASARIRSYNEILPFVELYRSISARVVAGPKPRILVYGRRLPAYDSLSSIVRAGEQAFPRFLKVWQRQIEPAELANIATWEAQAVKCHPMDSLQVISRLRFPSATVDVGAIYMHFSGSGNYTPMGVYSRTFDGPNLAFTLGHEATHLLVNPLTGNDWRRVPAADAVLRRASQVKLTADDLDELLALLMQVKLPQACGLNSANRRISDAFATDTLRHRILVALEDRWGDYRLDRRQWPTLIDYFLDRPSAALAVP